MTEKEKIKLDNFDEMLGLFIDMVNHADEDCPQEYRSKHFKVCLEDSTMFITDLLYKLKENDSNSSSPEL